MTTMNPPGAALLASALLLSCTSRAQPPEPATGELERRYQALVPRAEMQPWTM